MLSLMIRKSLNATARHGLFTTAVEEAGGSQRTRCKYQQLPSHRNTHPEENSPNLPHNGKNHSRHQRRLQLRQSIRLQRLTKPTPNPTLRNPNRRPHLPTTTTKIHPRHLHNIERREARRENLLSKRCIQIHALTPNHRLLLPLHQQKRRYLNHLP